MPGWLSEIFGLLGWPGTPLLVVTGVAFLWGRRGHGRVLTAAGSKNRTDFETIRGEWAGEDGQNDVAVQYRRMIGALLHGFARFVELRPGRDDASRQTFSTGAYFFSLALAVFYPIFFLVAAWAGGGSGQLGGLDLLPRDAAPWAKGLLLAALILPAAALLLPRTSDTRRVLAFAVTGALALALAVAGAVAVAGALALALAFAGAGTLAFAGGLALALALAFAGAGGLAFALVFALVFAALFAARHAETVRAGWAVAVVFGLGIVAGLLTLFALDGGMDGIAITGVETEGRTATATIILFVGLLPAANALLDWISLGITRSLLVWLVQKGHGLATVLALALADLAIAAVFFIGVALAATATLAKAERLHALGGAEPVFSTSALLTDLGARPLSADHAWIYAMLGTTLIPTVFHFFVMAGATIGGLRAGWVRERIETYLTAADPTHPDGQSALALNDAALWIGCVRGLSILIPGALVIGAVWLYVTFGAPGMRFLLTCAQAVNGAIKSWSGWPWF